MSRLTQEEVTAERKRYMAKEIDHQTYYCWLADRLGISIMQVPFSLEQLKASTDPHFNDLSLRTWDSMDAVIRPCWLPWSLSDTVCVLKAVAQREIRHAP